MHNKMNNEKAKNFKKAISSLISYLHPYFPFIIAAIILSTISSALYIQGPGKIKDITNLIIEGVMSGIDLEQVKSIAIFLLIIYTFSSLCDYLTSYIMVSISQKVSKGIRSDITRKINRLPLKYFDHTSYGDILSRETNDSDTIGQSLNQSVSSLVSACTMLIGSLIMMISTNGEMALTAILASFIGFAFISIISSKSQKYFNANQHYLGVIDGHIEEVYSGHNVIRVSNAQKEAKDKFNEINEKLYQNGWKSQFFAGMMPSIMGFIGNFGYVAVCVVGSILVLNNKIEFGVIVAFMMYVRMFTQPLSQIAQGVQSLQSAAAASERVFDFLKEEELSPEKKDTKYLNPSEVVGNIEFKNVKFGYDKDKIIIKGFNAHIKAGEKVAIVGPTGAGKTTMVNLLMRFYEMNSGDITIDGISIKDLTRENIHDLFCMVLQDTWVFNGTIKENICYNTKNVSTKDIEEVCTIVGLDHYIKTLPNSYDSMLNDTDSLSAGQKQLLTIARGMLKGSPLLILDEATSNVDTRTEELVQKAMDKLTDNKTSFIIAHRLSTIKNADLILVVDNGNIVEQGTHDNLLAQNGVYANLYNSQFKQ